MQIEVNNTRLFFDVYGAKLNVTPNGITEKPTLVVLHGAHGLADHTLYVEFWSQFADIAQVIFLDQRGCGRSDPGKPSEWNLKQWADDLHKFFLKLGIEKPIIAGVSMGAHVMCDYISQHADYPGGLIFCNTEAKFSLNKLCEKLKQLGANQKTIDAARLQYTQPTLETLQKFGKLCVPYYGHHPYTPKELNRCLKHPEVFMHFCKNEVCNFTVSAQRSHSRIGFFSELSCLQFF